MKAKYNPGSIEPKWQKIWDEKGLYKVSDTSQKQKFYHLEAFPYSSGDAHIGHWYAYAPSDIYARYKRLCGYNVLCPMGFDSFGLPAEGAAIKHKVQPRDWTDKNVAHMVEQFKKMGNIFDWSRTLATHREDYYRWTQWLFLKLYESGLAYKAKAMANWCSHCQSILANEQASSGRCWRCGNQVQQKEVEQWFFKITDYAEDLLNSLEELDWPQETLKMQRNWIGRSEGVEIDFPVKGSKQVISTFTTRPDTVYGVTFMVLAPEYPGLEKLVSTPQKSAVKDYIEKSKGKSELDRISNAGVKTGVFTGSFGINPLNGEEFPIWVADYVVGTYGTGAVMGVPAYDERDKAFVKKYGLGFKDVPLEDMGAITAKIVESGLGRKKVNYHLRDWLVSRQRYWGAPIPIVYCDECGTQPVPFDDLPVKLPSLNDYTSHRGESPLARSAKFVNTRCPQCGGKAKRDTDTMDTFVCSSWYYLRYVSPHSSNKPFDKSLVNKWLPVDCYTIGVEHALLHLLYSRFITKFLNDAGFLEFREPFKRLRHQGMVLGPDHQKMSKSRGNVVVPQDYVSKYGADTVRMYLGFMGPWDRGGPWDPQGIIGVYKFLQRIWSLFFRSDKSQPTNQDVKRALHRLIKKVGLDIESMRFNTAVAALMEFYNVLNGRGGNMRAEDWERFLIVLAPFAPHITEELWQTLGRPFSIHNQSWPKFDKNLAVEDTVTLAVQVNGKTRTTMEASKDASKEKLFEEASARAANYLKGREILKKIFVSGKVINFVVGR